VPKRLEKRLARLEELAQAEPQTEEARDLFARIKQLTEAYRRGERSGDLEEYAEVLERLEERLAGGGGDG